MSDFDVAMQKPIPRCEVCGAYATTYGAPGGVEGRGQGDQRTPTLCGAHNSARFQAMYSGSGATHRPDDEFYANWGVHPGAGVDNPNYKPSGTAGRLIRGE